MLAGVQAVVGAEHDVGVAQLMVGRQRRLDLGDHVVDRLHVLDAQAERRVDLLDLRTVKRLVAVQPGRRVGRQHVEVRRAGRLQAPEVVPVAGGGNVRRMRGERRELQEERLV